MNKGKVVRLAGFVGALGLSTVLVTTAIQGTGAYFSDSAGGSITGNTGTLGLEVSTAGGDYESAAAADLGLNFVNMWPGNRSEGQSIGYKVNATGGTVDLWLTFEPDGAGYQILTGGKDAPLSEYTLPDGSTNKGGLGQYGFFQVNDNYGGQAFKTSNLAFNPLDSLGEDPTTANDCKTDANGRGGSNYYVQSSTDGPSATPAGTFESSGYCGIPSEILLRQDIQNGWEGNVTIILGLNGFKAGNGLQDQQLPTVPFHLVATQHGQRP